MKAIILDMYGVIVKQTGDDFGPMFSRLFLSLSRKKYSNHGIKGY